VWDEGAKKVREKREERTSGNWRETMGLEKEQLKKKKKKKKTFSQSQARPNV